MVANEKGILKRLLFPNSIEEFWKEIFEKKCLFSAGELLFTNKDLIWFEKLLWAHESIIPDQVDVNKQGKSSSYNRIKLGKDPFAWLMDCYRDGATIIFNGLDDIDPEVADVVRPLDKIFKGKTTANAFLTPPKSRGFMPHFDTHDVFIVQLAGEKMWHLYKEEMELPLDNQIYLIDQEKLSEPSKSYLLRPGNVLYIPRGFIHGAYTENNYSLHLTIGIRPLLGIDYLESMLEVLSKENPDLRKSLINDYEDTASVRIGTLLETFFEESKNPYHRKLTREKINAKLASSAKVLPGQLFETSHQFESLALETKVRKANASNDALVEENGRVRLIFPGSGFAMANNPRPGYIEFPMTAYGALIFIMEQEADFCAGELSGFYPDDSKLLIVSELLKAGYLVFPDQL